MTRIVLSKKSTTILASAARTVTGQSGNADVGNGEKVAILLDVTAVTGTSPSMTVNLEWSHDGSTWFVGDPADAFTAITATGKKAKLFEVKGLYFQLNYTITGTSPSFTFAAHAVTGS